MKFRAQLQEAGSMRQFSNIINTLSKLSKTCILRICSDRMVFIVPDDYSLPYKISVWCILHSSEFFNAYTMAGDKEKNEIYLEFSCDMLGSSLSSIKAAGNNVISLKIKLTHKGSPCLSLELELSSQSSHSQVCIHDIPVTVKTNQDWTDYEEPEITNYNLTIQAPPTKVLKNVMDKFKKINNKVIITATTQGSLSLLANAATANIETHFKDLPVQKIHTNDSTSFSVCVDVRKMSQFLTCDAINPHTIVCKIVDGHMLHLCLSHTGFQLNYYLMGFDD